ncbi:MAG: anti-sigma F factor [Clostridia bacterium]|nr:anti-sigma F factor [Clostridia bacterium]
MENNKIKIEFLSYSENEYIARGFVSVFASTFNPSVSWLSDVKTAVSEGVTNCIVHAYPNEIGKIILELEVNNNYLHINIYDFGVGIDNVNKAIEPFYTSKPNEERSGMGFTIMQSFMDDVKIESALNKGTSIFMCKKLLNSVEE